MTVQEKQSDEWTEEVTQLLQVPSLLPVVKTLITPITLLIISQLKLSLMIQPTIIQIMVQPERSANLHQGTMACCDELH